MRPLGCGPGPEAREPFVSAAGNVWLNAAELGPVEVLREECDTILCRIYRDVQGDDPHTVLALLLTAEQPTATRFDRLAHEYALKLDLDDAWAARPLELVRECGRTALSVTDRDGDPLDSLLGPPMETGSCQGCRGTVPDGSQR